VKVLLSIVHTKKSLRCPQQLTDMSPDSYAAVGVAIVVLIAFAVWFVSKLWQKYYRKKV
jgi:hypothetical protein